MRKVLSKIFNALRLLILYSIILMDILFVLAICGLFAYSHILMQLYVRDCSQLAENNSEYNRTAINFQTLWDEDYDSPITVENIRQLELTETALHPEELYGIRVYGVVNNSTVSQHPSGDLTIYRIRFASNPPEYLTICDSNNKVRKVLDGYYSVPVFNYDGSRFVTYNHDEDTYQIFDSTSLEVTAELASTIWGRFALHPTEPILAILNNTYDSELYRRSIMFLDYETSQEIHSIVIPLEARTITFDVSGTALVVIFDGNKTHTWTIPA